MVSRRRALQADQTRRDIIVAARRLFAADGYQATSMKAIGEAAGVSVQTVYDSVGSKAALLLALNDELDSVARVRDVADALLASESSSDVVAVPARITRAILDNAIDIVRVVTIAAASEPEVRQALEAGRKRHLAGTTAVVRKLERLGALRPDVTPSEAQATLSTLTDTGFGLLLHDTYGWSTQRIERWTIAALRRLLLPEPRS
jgi:AcrR family transcriptional regulator